jgi:hypothetical protein
MARLLKLVLRIVAFTVVAMLLICATGVTLLVMKRDALLRRGLELAASRTGAVVEARRLDFGVATSGLEVDAKDVSVAYRGQSARAKRIEVVIGYTQLLRLEFLPLKSVNLVEPEVSVVRTSGSSEQRFNLGEYVALLPEVADQAAHYVQHAGVMGGKIRLVSLASAGQPVPSVDLDVSVDAESTALTVGIRRIAWNGPPADGFAASAEFTIPTLEDEPSKRARGAVEFIRRSNVQLNGKLQFAVAEVATIRGRIQVRAGQVSALGELGFEGSYSLSADRVKLSGDMLVLAGIVVNQRVPAELNIASPFSGDPKLDFACGPFQVQVGDASKALDVAQALSPGGQVRVERVQFATGIKRWREALAHCSDATCRKRQMLAMLLGASSGALLIGDAELAADSVPLPPHLSQLGPPVLRLENPVRFTLGNGAITAENMAARVGAFRITRGEFRVDSPRGAGGDSIALAYNAGFFAELDLSPSAWGETLPVRARGLLRPPTAAYAQVNLGGTIASDNGRFAAHNPWMEVSRGFVEIADRNEQNAVTFSGRAELEPDVLVSSARVTVLGGGTASADGRFNRDNRMIRARLGLRRVNVWRWYRTLVKGSGASRLKLAGEANGQATVQWQVDREPPQVNGSLSVTNLTVDSAYTKEPVLVRRTQVVFNQHGARVLANRIILGGGHFNVDATVQDFLNLKVNVAIYGDRLDVDALDFNALHSASNQRNEPSGNAAAVLHARSGTHASSSGLPGAKAASAAGEATPPPGDAHGDGAAPSKPAAHTLALSGSADIGTVFFRGETIGHLTARFDGEGNQWELTKFSAQALRGSIKMAMLWDGKHRRIYLTANTDRIDARALFVALGSKRNQPLSGELSMRSNLGAVLPGGGAQPIPLCGGATIMVDNGALGKADVIVRIMQVLSLQSWLTFHPPDLDKTGLPFDRIIARLTFAPKAITVRQLQLSGPVIRLVGQGKVALPDERLDLHLAVMPFTSPRWALDKVPLMGQKLGHTFDKVFSVRIKVSGPPNASNVSPEFLGSVMDSLTGILELPLAFVPTGIVPDERLLLPSAQSPGAFNKCAPPP